jgi:hypothetical protein
MHCDLNAAYGRPKRADEAQQLQPQIAETAESDTGAGQHVKTHHYTSIERARGGMSDLSNVVTKFDDAGVREGVFRCADRNEQSSLHPQ